MFGQAQTRLSESSQKLELMKVSLEKRLTELEPYSGKVEVLKEELNELMHPAYSGQRLSHTTLHRNSPLAKPASLTGKLEVRLVCSVTFCYRRHQ